MRDIAYRNQRIPPKPDKEGMIDPKAMRRYQDDISQDARNDIAQLDQTTSDVRDRVSFKTDGQGRFNVKHGMSYVPMILSWNAIYDGDDVITMHQYKDADRQSLYLRVAVVDKITNQVSDAPKGVRITLFLHPETR